MKIAKFVAAVFLTIMAGHYYYFAYQDRFVCAKESWWGVFWCPEAAISLTSGTNFFRALFWPLQYFDNTNGSAISKRGNLGQFNTSLDFANQATLISNRLMGLMSLSDMEQMIRLRRKSIEAGMRVDIVELNDAYPGFGDNFREQFIMGSKLFLRGLENNNPTDALSGQILLGKWGDWYQIHAQYIRRK
jgi:hypothetical protein